MAGREASESQICGQAIASDRLQALILEAAVTARWLAASSWLGVDFSSLSCPDSRTSHSGALSLGMGVTWRGNDLPLPP